MLVCQRTIETSRGAGPCAYDADEPVQMLAHLIVTHRIPIHEARGSLPLPIVAAGEVWPYSVPNLGALDPERRPTRFPGSCACRSLSWHSYAGETLCLRCARTLACLPRAYAPRPKKAAEPVVVSESVAETWEDER